MSSQTFFEIWAEARGSSKNNKEQVIKEVFFNETYSPVKFFDFLKSNHDAVIFIQSPNAEKILKSPIGLNILKGAVCSTLDGSKWQVDYEGHKSFIFKGSIVMLTAPGAINWSSKRYFYLKRDQAVIEDLQLKTDRYNEVIQKRVS